MTMILAKRMSDWFLAAFASHLRGCNLSINREPREDADQFHAWQGNIRVWSHAPVDGITFYPTLRYMGIPVYVGRGWHPDSDEPLLGLLLGDINPTIEAETGLTVAMMPEVNRRRADDEEAWNRFHERWKEGGAKVMQRILNDGWERTLHGIFKYVHVADPNLEKIEGPPPEGPF